MGCKRGTILPNGRIIPVRFIHRQKAAFRFFRKESPLLGKDIDCFRYRICTFIYVERAYYAKRYNHTANGRDGIRHVQKLAFTLVLIASFILLYQSKKFSNAVGNLRFYGKMSLTNYITQSIIGAFIYFPFGFILPLIADIRLAC